MSKAIECSSPCATCPFLRANFGKPNPDGYDPKRAAAERPDHDFFDWYSEKNLRRIWRGGLSKGEAMVCHATDPGAINYGGKPAAPGHERICVGAFVVVFLHMKEIETLLKSYVRKEAFRIYRLRAGRFPITQAGMMAWAQMIAFGRTGLLGGLSLPQSVPGDTVAECGVPWADHITNERERQTP
jgi:hypothetical protein